MRKNVFKQLFEITSRPAQSMASHGFQLYQFLIKKLEYFLFYFAFSTVTLIEAGAIWLPCYLYRYAFVNLILNLLGHICHWEILDPKSILFADKEYSKKSQESFRANSVCLIQLDSEISLDQLERILWRNITLRLQSYPVKSLGYWFWKRDKRFRMKNHVTELKYYGKIWDTRAMGRLHQKILNGEFPEKRSPWNVTLIHIKINNQSASLIAIKVHQCLGGGDLISKELLGITRRNQEIAGNQTDRKLSYKSRLEHAIELVNINVNLLFYQKQAQRHPWKMSARNKLGESSIVVRFTKNISMDYIKAIAHFHQDAPPSVIMVSAVAGAINKFLPESVPASAVLVNLISAGGEYTQHSVLDSVTSSESSVIKLEDMINELGSALVRPFRSHLAVLRAFIAEINVLGDDSSDFDVEIDGPPKVRDFSLSTLQKIPCFSLGVSFTAYCFKNHVRFCINAASFLLKEAECENLMRLVEQSIVEAYQRTKS